VVIKGKSVAGANRLAAHLERTDTNERAEVVELRDVAAADLQGALREMEAVASGCPNCKKPFYHASVNTRADERMTPEQRMQAIDRLEKDLGLTGQPRAVVVHEKEGREHCHVVWSRIDLDKMRTISDSHNYRTHELVARELEREFGHARVQGAHVEREGKERPERTPSHKEHQQAERTGISPKQAREQITALWRSTDSGQAFQAALEEKGWLLARGDRRDFVAVDPKGGTHSLARRIEGATAKDVRARLADLDPRGLPSVAEAKEAQQQRQPAREQPREQPRAAAAPSRTQEAPTASKGRPDKREGVRVAAGALRGVGKVLDGAASLFESLLGGGPAKPQQASKDDPGQPLGAGAVQPPDEREEAVRREQDARSARRQELMRDHGREVPEETARDAEIERDKRGRERER
jgi:Relaxase/Mobilisation nuclease domain